jgi:penicillin-binding protein 1A
VQAAAQNYFGKNVEELNLAECATLAGLPQAPSRYSPYSHPNRAKERQVYVLNRMVADGYISTNEAAEALAYELDIKKRTDWDIGSVPYFTEHIRRYLEEKYGEEALYQRGYGFTPQLILPFKKRRKKPPKKVCTNWTNARATGGPLIS